MDLGRLHDSDGKTFELMIGNSAALQRVLETIERIAPTTANVFIFGETGTGKELVARTIHHQSRRKDSDFVPVDCVAIPGDLFESELFGFERGTFTGADESKSGLLELADGGTLFLDEVSEIDIKLQSKLLRVLQERQFRRLGSKKFTQIDLRVISAMNMNPRRAISGGHLREDLYYRLNVIPIYLPPLRHRITDIPLLVNHFLEKVSQEDQLNVKEVSPRAMACLKQYPWPGNIRQLQNIIARMVLLSQHPVIDVEDLPDSIKQNSSSNSGALFDIPFMEAKKKHVERFEKKYFGNLLRKNDGNISKAAKMAKISERTIYRMIERYGKF